PAQLPAALPGSRRPPGRDHSLRVRRRARRGHLARPRPRRQAAPAARRQGPRDPDLSRPRLRRARARPSPRLTAPKAPRYAPPMGNDDALRGRIAWVTGSSRGMGRVIARQLASQGARVVVHGTTPTSSRAFGEADSLDEVARLMAAETG